MTSPGEVYRAAEIGVYQEIVDRFLQPYWNIIAGNGSDGKPLPLPAASDFDRMARELVESRNAEGGPQFTLPAANGAKVVRINAIKEQVTKLAGSSGAGLVAGFGAVDDIPDTDKVHKMASAVERGVAKGSSWWNVFRADPLGTILDLVVGFFTGTLRQRMGERFARNASTAVQQELSEVRNEPGMETLLTSERVMAIGERVAEEARRVAASPGHSSQPSGIRLRDDIRTLTGGDLFKPVAETTLRTYVSDAFKKRDPKSGKSARDLLKEGQTSYWTLGLIAHGALKEHEANAVEKRVADAFVKVVTDGSFRFNGKKTYELSDAELKAAAMAEVGAAIHALHKERGWSYAEKRVNGIAEALQNQLASEQIGKMRQASSLANGQGLAAMISPEAKERAARERRIHSGHGVSGAHDAAGGGAARPEPGPRSRTAGTTQGSLPASSKG